MHVTVTQALILAIWVGLVMSRSMLGGATLTLRFSPMMTGLVAGVVFGDVANAMMITAAIQLIYMGVFAPGGQMPSEPAVAAAIAVPVALLSNMKPEAAIAIAVPVGLLGSYLYQARFFVNTFFIERTVDKYAKAANFKMLSFSIIGIPIIVGMLLYVPFMFITLYYGAPVIADFVAANSATLLFHVLTVIGGGLVSIGIAVTVYVIGKKNYIVFFLLAYFLATTVNGIIGGINKVSGVAELKPDTSAVTVPGVTMITYAIIGGIVAFLYVILRKESAEEKSAAVKVADASDNAAAAGDDDDDY